MLTKKIRELYNKHKLARAVDTVIKSTALISASAISAQVLAVLTVPQAVHAKESQTNKLFRQPLKRYQLSYNNLISKTLNQKDFQNLNVLLGKAKKQIKPRKSFTKEQAVEYLDEILNIIKKEEHLIPEEFAGKRCHVYSSFFLGTGEHAGMRLAPFYIPQRHMQPHLLLRCEPCDDKPFLYDPLFGGVKDASFYESYFDLSGYSDNPKILDYKEFNAVQLTNIGATWHEKGEYEKAADFYAQALRSNPDYAPAHNNLGVVHAKLGRYAEAIACYEEAISLSQDYSAAFNNQAISYFRMGKFDKALEFFDKAIKADPKNIRAYNNKGAVLYEIGREKAAFECFSKVVELKQEALEEKMN